MKKYYRAYDKRYKKIHRKGHMWSSDNPTPLVMDILNKYHINKDSILEIGCGEGRDSIVLLEQGYDLLATDISPEAIKYCQRKYIEFRDNFMVLDCINDKHTKTYDFIFAVAVLHMFVLDEDRKKFYEFIYKHLNPNGLALVLSMGDGTNEMTSNIKEAFKPKERNHESGVIKVAATSCRIVNMETFKQEIKNNGFDIVESGITHSEPDFDNLLFAVIKKENN